MRRRDAPVAFILDPDVITAILRHLRRQGRDPRALLEHAADDCADDPLAKRDMLRYDEDLAKGLSIPTGVVEGARRHVIEDRVDIAGTCWTVPGAEAVLQLRAMRSSGDFEAYGRHHLHREDLRHHGSSHAAKPAREAA